MKCTVWGIVWVIGLLMGFGMGSAWAEENKKEEESSILPENLRNPNLASIITGSKKKAPPPPAPESGAPQPSASSLPPLPALKPRASSESDPAMESGKKSPPNFPAPSFSLSGLVGKGKDAGPRKHAVPFIAVPDPRPQGIERWTEPGSRPQRRAEQDWLDRAVVDTDRIRAWMLHAIATRDRPMLQALMETVGGPVALRTYTEGVEFQPMLAAMRAGDAGMMAWLLRLGYPAHETDAQGMTPLHYAAATGNVALLRALLDGGARTEATTRVGGYTPAMLAAYYGRTDVVSALRAHSSGNMRDAYGRTLEELRRLGRK